MPRRAASSISLVGRVRTWFGLRQDELALYLGVSPSLVRDLETLRRPITHPVSVALGPLQHQLPPPEVVAATPDPEAPLPPATPAPDADDLDFRRRECLHRAERLLREAEALAARARVAARWAAALPRLRAALPPPPPEGEAPRTAEAVRLRYVHGWLETVPLALEPEQLALWHLRHQRALALEAEAAALAALLAGATG